LLVKGTTLPVSEVQLFVYGILRPADAQGLGWEGGYTRPPILNATIEGNLYWLGYPGGIAGAKVDELGTIVGDIIFLDSDSEEYVHIVHMESGAGYELRTVTATHSSPSGPAVGVPVLSEVCVWHYKRPCDPALLIEGGDYIKGCQDARRASFRGF
jgi:gamma-glutamylcyclotransferase (GGCT)/AIG2-like uncharacterized protein YtfP